MDCKLARECLETARPDSRDREDSELIAAFAHVDECAACAEAIEFRRAFDRRLGAVVRSVDVPPDLQSRLLASVTTAPPTRVDDAVASPPSRRRPFLASMPAAVLLVAAGWMWWAAQSQPAPLAAATVMDWCRTNLAHGNTAAISSFVEFDDDFDATVTDGRWASRLGDAPPRGADLDGDGKHDVAVYTFSGVYLVILAPDRVTDPPAATAATTATPYYTPAPHVAWTYDRRMYVCVVPAKSPAQLNKLLRQVYGTAA